MYYVTDINFTFQAKDKELSDNSTKISTLTKENSKKENELSERRHEIEVLQTQLSKAKEEIATKSDSPPEVDNMEVEEPPLPPQPMMTQELAYYAPEMKKEDIFKVVRPVDLLGMVGRLGLLAQSGMEQDLFLLPDSANDDVIPRVLDFFRLADGVEFSADRPGFIFVQLLRRISLFYN